MGKIHKILFPTDFSETAQNAFCYCLLLADRFEAEIALLHVVYPEYEVMDLPVMAVKATKDKLAAARSALSSFSALGAREAGKALSRLPVVQGDVEVGSPAGAIAKAARREEADLIVMGTKGEHNALEYTLGSVSTGVAEHAPCPVLVVPESAEWKPVQAVAFATDLSESDPFHVWKTIQLLAPFHPIIHVVHVANGEHPRTIADMEDFFAHNGNNTEALQITFHELDHASVAAGLEEFVANHNIDLLAMYAPKHSWLDRLLRQSNTRKMIFETTTPLLLLKPE